jgi:hypothetical protein
MMRDLLLLTSKTVWIGMLAGSISLSGCASFTGPEAPPAAEKPKFVVPPGGLAADKAAGSTWGRFQPVAMSWTGNAAPAFAPPMPALPHTDTNNAVPIADGLPSAAWPAAAQVPPAGPVPQSLVQSASASFSAAPVAPKPVPAASVPVATLVGPGADPTLGPLIAPPPAFAALSAFTSTVSSLPKPRSSVPAIEAAPGARQVSIATVQPVRAPMQPSAPPTAFASLQGSQWVTPARPVATFAMSQVMQQPRRFEVVVVDYSALTRYAPPAVTYPAPATHQVQQLGQVTIDYSVLQY